MFPFDDVIMSVNRIATESRVSPHHSDTGGHITHQETGSSLAQLMDCIVFGVKPLADSHNLILNQKRKNKSALHLNELHNEV